MSTKEWLEGICIRAQTESHLSCLINPNKANGLVIATIFEDELGNDMAGLPENRKGQIRFVVLNESHRDYLLTFNSRATREALSFNGSSAGTCQVEAQWIEDKAQQSPMYETLSVQLRDDAEKAMEVFSTTPLMRLIPKKPRPVEEKHLRAMRNVVAIRPPRVELENSKGENTMPKNYLKAVGEGVAALAGPVGAPLRVLLSLYADELKDKENEKNTALQELIESSNQIQRKQIEEIFEVRQDMSETRTLLVELLTPLLERVRLSHSKTPEALVPAAGNLMLADSLVEITNEDSLVAELRRLFATDTKLFISLLPNDFPVDTFNSNEAAAVVFKSFVRTCRGLDPRLLCSTFAKLSKEKPSSRVFERLSSLHCEAANAVK